MPKELARDLLDSVVGGNLQSTFGSPSLLGAGGSSGDAQRPIAESFDPLRFASSRLANPSVGGDGRLRLPPIERRPRRLVRGTVSTAVVISPLGGSEARGTRVVRRGA